jgi:lycopene beta-cyclase
MVPRYLTLFISLVNPIKERSGFFSILKAGSLRQNKPTFESSEATIMDFRVHQLHGTTFAYVLPFNETTALVEYTLFTKELLLKEQYNAELRKYISQYLCYQRLYSHRRGIWCEYR